MILARKKVPFDKIIYVLKVWRFWFTCLETVVIHKSFDPLSANLTKSSNTFKQFVCKLPTNCLSVFAHLVGLTLKRLKDGSVSEKFRIIYDLIKCSFFTLISMLWSFIKLIAKYFVLKKNGMNSVVLWI